MVSSKLEVTNTPKDIAGCGWYEILPRPKSYDGLTGKHQYDWVIIGAGYTGLSAAKRLLQRTPDATVAVIDAQSIAWGAAGRNSGFMIDLPHDVSAESYSGGHEKDLREIRTHRKAISFATEIVEEYRLQDFFSTCGKYHGAVDQSGIKHLETYTRQLDRLGERYSLLDQVQMRAVTGSDFYLGGMHSPGSAMIQPAGYIRGLADGLSEQGVSIFENSPVRAIEKGERHRVITDQGEISSANIILCVNGHAQSFGYYQRRLIHLFLYASMSRALTETEMSTLGGISEWGITPADPLGSTVRRYRDRILIRNSVSYTPHIDSSAAMIKKTVKQHDLSFRKRFPMLTDVSMEYHWGGHLCMSLNSMPGFGELEPGIFSAVCQNGLGVTNGTYAGMAIVDLATGQQNDIVADMPVEQPNKLPPEPFMTLGTKASLYWKQHKAKKEL